MVKSAASEVHFDTYKESALDRQEGISDSFEGASKPELRADLLADYADQVGDGERESEMVKEDAMTHDMRPPPEVSAEVDRETFDAKWEAEQQNARDDLLADYEQQAEYSQEGYDQENSL